MQYKTPVPITTYSSLPKPTRQSTHLLAADAVIQVDDHTGTSQTFHMLPSGHDAFIQGYYYDVFNNQYPDNVIITPLATHHYSVKYHASDKPDRVPKLVHESSINKALIFKIIQSFHIESGGRVSSALFQADGQLLSLGQDITDPVALYKVLGLYFQLDDDLPAVHSIMTTGLITPAYISIAKRLAARFIISKQGTTQTAYQQSLTSGISLIGLARSDRFSVFKKLGAKKLFR